MTKATHLAIGCVALLAMMGVPNAVAQGGRAYQGGGWRASTGYVRPFDPATVETINGTVVAVHYTRSQRNSAGVHLAVQTVGDVVEVHLGPSWFVENQAARISRGDAIEVRGSRVTYGGKPAIIAASVTKGGEVVRLRDANGFPLWSGPRRR